MSQPALRRHFTFSLWEKTSPLSGYESGNFDVFKAADVEQVLKDVTNTLTLLRDYTFLDAEPPELRAQNERCHREAVRLLARLTEGL